MSPPTVWQHFREIIGRAIRETGQAIDRVGVKWTMVSLTAHKYDYYDDPVIFEDFFSRHRHQFPLLTSGRPILSREVAFLAPCSTLIGTVVVGKNSSIWYGAVLRGDYGRNAESFRKIYNTEDPLQDETIQPWALEGEEMYRHREDHHGGAIFVGEDTNLQDGCIVTARSQHTTIGNGVTVGHLAQLHSCTVGNYALIGMGSVINAGAVIEDEAMVAAGAVIPAGTTVKTGELWIGNPARKMRDLTTEQRQRLHYQSSEYVNVAMQHQSVMKIGGNLDENGVSVVLLPSGEDDIDYDEEKDDLYFENINGQTNVVLEAKEPVKELEMKVSKGRMIQLVRDDVTETPTSHNDNIGKNRFEAPLESTSR